MTLSLNACCGSLASGTISTAPSSTRSPSMSSAVRCQLGSMNRRPFSNADFQSITSRDVLPFQRGIRQRESVKQHRLSTVCAATPDLAGGRQKVAPLTIKDAKIVAEPPQDGKLKIRVDVDGQATKRAFDTVLKDLARHAPPVPGFRKAKGGKTSIVPLNVIYQLMGPKLVRKFVIEEILKATLNDYVQKEGIKVKNELKTDQSSEELSAGFEPGTDFGFDATLDLADEQIEETEKTEAADEMTIQSEPLEASV